MRIARVGLVGLMMVAAVVSRERTRRNRGEGLYKCVNSNTVGSGNIWATVRGIGFIWDADQKGDEKKPKPFPFLEARVVGGIFNVASVFVESRAMSYFWGKRPQFGNVSGGVKLTLPNNKDLRYHGLGLETRFIWNHHENFPSLGGYRTNGISYPSGSGFAPEGFIVHGPSLQFKLLYDRDYLARHSKLPLRLFVNAGARIPLGERAFRPYSQYLVDVGVAYAGRAADVFVEYSFEGFVNPSTKPKKFSFRWAGWDQHKIWEVAFVENPMYLTVGGRVRYPNGLVLFGCVPLLLSVNRGSDMTYGGDWQRLHSTFPDEEKRGIRDPFDPWFAKWKIVGELSFPIRFKQTGAEMRRSFLLMKNRRGGKKIDIDERLKALEEEPAEQEDEKSEQEQTEEDEDAKRLEEIRRRRQEIGETE